MSRDDRIHRRISRRGVLRLAAVGGVSSLAGCEGITNFESPNIGGVAVPPLKRGWLEVRENGDAEFAIQFDGNIRSRIKFIPGLSESDVFSSFDRKGYEIKFGPVEIDGTESVPDNQLVQGTIESFAEVHNWPVGRRYRTPRITFSSKAEKLPRGNDLLHVRFPDGYEYTLPDDHLAVSEWTPEGGTQTESPFGYGPHDIMQTFPFINHYNHPDLAWMHWAAQFKHEFLYYQKPPVNQSEQGQPGVIAYFNVDWYVNQTLDDARDLARAVAQEIVKEAFESLVTSPIPDELSIVFDTKSVADALNADFLTKKDNRSFDLSAGIARGHTIWLNTFYEGFSELSQKSSDEIKRNLLLVGVPDAAKFKQNVTRYMELLREQQSIIEGMRSSVREEEKRMVALSGSDSNYWANLYRYGLTILDQYMNIIQKEQRVLDRLKTNL